MVLATSGRFALPPALSDATTLSSVIRIRARARYVITKRSRRRNPLRLQHQHQHQHRARRAGPAALLNTVRARSPAHVESAMVLATSGQFALPPAPSLATTLSSVIRIRARARYVITKRPRRRNPHRPLHLHRPQHQRRARRPGPAVLLNTVRARSPAHVECAMVLATSGRFALPPALSDATTLSSVILIRARARYVITKRLRRRNPHRLLHPHPHPHPHPHLLLLQRLHLHQRLLQLQLHRTDRQPVRTH